MHNTDAQCLEGVGVEVEQAARAAQVVRTAGDGGEVGEALGSAVAGGERAAVQDLSLPAEGCEQNAD
jgi:hypothetical protein